MIHSSAIEGHHFLMSRRRGYDPAEVDAVIKRIVDTLRKYEEREAELAAEAAAGLGVTDLELIRSAREGDSDAKTPEELAAEARELLDQAERTAAAEVAAAEEEAARIIEIARADASSLLSRRNARAEDLITAALAEVKALRARVLHETNEYRAGKRTEASALVRTANLHADQMLEDARHEAGSILGRARREQMVLEQRIGQLRSALAGIEGQFRTLAETTLEQTEIMSAMLSLETDALGDVLEDKHDAAPEESHEEPEVVRLTQGGLTVDLTDEALETSESVSAANQIDEHFVVAPGNTIYQRRGGGLRRRLEEEEVEELPE
ncbi:MAG: DivIVA domain-containing protein [Acidimicrobiia bacterium]|nr:DivIVA domain-containing protein [Acidimicrobiia bacterium]